ncbi:hypothetical protein HDE_07962 [Halotydeus destructor]|nr:hypothetical protein HDE_11064 [Halotydeus destructor]KAI1290588.1 hypothetical protein HDE_07962 [Halotydeus destructor]
MKTRRTSSEKRKVHSAVSKTRKLPIANWPQQESLGGRRKLLGGSVGAPGAAGRGNGTRRAAADGFIACAAEAATGAAGGSTVAACGALVPRVEPQEEPLVVAGVPARLSHWQSRLLR